MSKVYQCRIPEIDIPEDEPYRNDKLDREKVGDILTDMVTILGQPGRVLAIHGEWGAGKTTFIKMWKQSLTNQGFKTLYFNAWETDFKIDPLVPLISELQGISANEESSELFSKTLNIIFSAGKQLTKRATGIDVKEILNDIADNDKEAHDIFQEYTNRKQEISDFKREIQKFVADNAEDKPVVFLVDELDRCRPSYAVSVLERIKHLFDIPNMVFVLAINKTQLCNAIKGYYGSDQIDANEYLRRFIDIEYGLSNPNIQNYFDYLYTEYGFDDFFKNEKRMNSGSSSIYESEVFKSIAIQLFKMHNTNLRQIDRILAYTRLALMQFSYSSNIDPDIYILLCYWKVINPDFYNNIRELIYTPQEFLDELKTKLSREFFTSTIHDNISWNNAYTIAGLIYNYDISHSLNKNKRISSIHTKNAEGNMEYKIHCEYYSKEEFQETLKAYYHEHTRQLNNGLNNLLERIDLLGSFTLT